MTSAKEQQEAEAKLSELGFDLDASPDQALATLRALAGRPGVSTATIASALGRVGSAAAADILAEMEAGSSGADRREIRRALFKLRQRGIAPSTPIGVATPVERPAPAAAEPALSALVSPIDSEGARIVWLLKSRPQGGVNRLWGLVSESEGLIGAKSQRLSRRELRAERAELEQQTGLKMVEAAWRLADFIVCEAYRRTPEANRRRAGNFFALRAEMIATAPLTEAEFVHPVYTEMAAQAEGEPSAELLKEPEIIGWKFAPAGLKPYADEIAGLRESVLILNPVQQEERANTVVDRAIGELFAGERGTRVRRHLEDVAYYMAHTSRSAAAGWAVAAAAEIRKGADLKRLAFFQGLVRAQLSSVLAEQREREKEEPRLIVTPAEAMRARASRTRQR
jgi:hypothetical protein